MLLIVVVVDFISYDCSMTKELCTRGAMYHVMASMMYDIGWDRLFRFAIDIVKAVDYLHSCNPPMYALFFVTLMF